MPVMHFGGATAGVQCNAVAQEAQRYGSRGTRLNIW